MNLRNALNGAVGLVGVGVGIILTALAYFNVGSHPTLLGYFGIVLTVGFGLYFLWLLISYNPKKIKS